MNLERLIGMMRAHLWIMIVTLMVTVLTAALISYVQPYRYTSQATVLLDFKSSNPLGVGFGSQLPEGFIGTQLSIITSPVLAEKVLKKFDLETLAEVVEVLQKDSISVFALLKAKFAEVLGGVTTGKEKLENAASNTPSSIKVAPWMAHAMLRGLNAELMPGTRLITLEYKTLTPGLAETITNAFAEAYIVANLEMAVEPLRQSSQWFDKHINVLRSNLEEAQDRLTDYQQKHEIVATDERLDIENEKLRKLNFQLLVVKEKFRDALSKQRQLDDILERKGSFEELADFQSNSFILKLKTDLAAVERKRTELAGQLGENHPTYIAALTEMNELQQKLRKELRAVASSVRNSSQLAKEQQQVQERAVEKQKGRVLKLKRQRDQVAILAREVGSTQKVYEVALEQATTTQMESTVSQTNVSLFERASYNKRPASPKVTQNIVIAFILGGLLGALLSFFVEIADRRIRSAEDLEQGLGIPVLGILLKV